MYLAESFDLRLNTSDVNVTTQFHLNIHITRRQAGHSMAKFEPLLYWPTAAAEVGEGAVLHSNIDYKEVQEDCNSPK